MNKFSIIIGSENESHALILALQNLRSVSQSATEKLAIDKLINQIFQVR